jgi:hypothetical protein
MQSIEMRQNVPPVRIAKTAEQNRAEQSRAEQSNFLEAKEPSDRVIRCSQNIVPYVLVVLLHVGESPCELCLLVLRAAADAHAQQSRGEEKKEAEGQQTSRSSPVRAVHAISSVREFEGLKRGVVVFCSDINLARFVIQFFAQQSVNTSSETVHGVGVFGLEVIVVEGVRVRAVSSAAVKILRKLPFLGVRTVYRYTVCHEACYGRVA